MYVLRVRKGDEVNYRDPVQLTVIHRATCVGHGRKNRERIVFMDDGHWCYLTQVASATSVAKRQCRKRSSRTPLVHSGDCPITREELKLVVVHWGIDSGLVSFGLNEVLCYTADSASSLHVKNVPVAELTDAEMSAAFNDEPTWDDVLTYLLAHPERIGPAG